MQIKGGTENILIEDNTFHGSGSIFSGNDMNCDYYCGSPKLPTLPVPERYVAKNVIIRNNLFYNLSESATTGIKGNGWIDSQIYNNTFYDLGNSWAILFQGNTAGLKYFDEAALEYCDNNEGECSECGEDYCKIKHDPRNIQIRNNIFLNQTMMASVDNASTNISFSNNIYWNNGSQMVFREDGELRYSLEDFTHESNSYGEPPGLTDAGKGEFTLTENSVAIDHGYALLAPPTDYAGDPRDSNPDIGAYEYQSQNNGAIHYISETGVDPENDECRGGTAESPWQTWNGPYSSNCIDAGDTVYLKAGTYAASGSTFRNGIWYIQGQPGNNITVAVDPAAEGSWPVKITGKLLVFGENAVIDGFEFDGAADEDAVKNFASYITYQNNYIHSATRDCVRNLSTHHPGGERNTDISFIGNTISECGEDAIDNVGAKNVVIRGNDIFDHHSMQIKGGTENILIEENSFHDSGSIFSGNDMNCSYYCGSPKLPTLPVPERYVAKNVIIRNNIFYNLRSTASTGIKMNGWIDSQVYNNTFYDLGNSWAILLQGNTAGLKYFDETALEYCDNNEGECSECGDDYCIIKHDPDNIQIRNNIFLNQTMMASVDNASTNISFSNNIYWNDGSQMLFMENGELRYSLEAFTLESDSYEESPGLTDAEKGEFTLAENSVAIDHGYALLAPATDYAGDPRDSNPDIGAYEYQSQNPDPPDAPTGIEASDGTYVNKVTISWNSSDGATDYDVYRNTADNSSTASMLFSTHLSTSGDDENAESGQTYYYWVKAKKTIDGNTLESPFSDVDSGYASEAPPANQYTLTTSTQGNGTIGLSPASDVYDEGTSVTITATPGTDYQFDHWEGDISGSTNPLDITVTSDMSVTAVFTTIQNSEDDPGSDSGGSCFITVQMANKMRVEPTTAPRRYDLPAKCE
jgi:hypothetical protein